MGIDYRATVAAFIFLLASSVSAEANALGAAGVPADSPAAPGRLGPALPPAPRGFTEGDPVPDGSFENGAPPASSWTETTASACGTGIGSWSAYLTTAPDGSNSFWSGNDCTLDHNEIENSVTQSVAVPSDPPILIFWYLAYRIDTDDSEGTDVAYVSVNGTDKWTLDASTGATNTVGNGDYLCYRPARIDLSTFAGTTVSLKVGMTPTQSDNGAGNVVFDDFRFADLVFADGFECGPSYWSSTSP